MNYGTATSYLKKSIKELVLERHKLIDSWLLDNTISWLVCNKIFKKEIFTNLRFREDMIYEDNYIIIDVLQSIKKLFISTEGVYYYYRRENSTTNSTYSVKKDIDTQKVNFHILEALPKTTTTINVFMLSKIFNIYQSIYYSENEIKLNATFVNLLNKVTIISILRSTISFKEKFKLLILKSIGIANYLKYLN
jgi:IS4 transposase